MLVALPVESDKKENSILFGHFAVAPGFVTFDTETGDYGYIENSDGKADGGGSRNASETLASAGVTAVIAGGIGMGAINRLNSLGIRVYGSLSGMVLYELKLLESGKLPEMIEGNCDGAYRQDIMIIAFPVDKDSGLESSILSDFSSAKKILCYDTETEKLLCTDGYDSEELLRDTGAEAVIVKDIPCGTIAELKKIGIRVYGAKTDIVGEDLKNFLKDEYRQMFSGDCDGSCR